MADTGLKLETATVQRLADGRFLGQGFDLVVPLPRGPYEDAGGAARAPGRVRDRVSREVRADAAGRAGGVHQHPRGGAGARVGQRGGAAGRGGARRAPATLKGTRRAYFPEAGGLVETAVYDR